MKAYKGKFKKKDGSERTMVFTRIDDLPSKFVASKISGSGWKDISVPFVFLLHFIFFIFVLGLPFLYF